MHAASGVPTPGAVFHFAPAQLLRGIFYATANCDHLVRIGEMVSSINTTLFTDSNCTAYYRDKYIILCILLSKTR